ncbi:hypothetical protein GCM10022235_58680 [Kribbella ginsengisoli]|uniref:Uncharacterized protein n=1 Tax=Kribbella ginsengisoli TaxID=363865 RepID=A0ABP6YDD2_9ACTN
MSLARHVRTTDRRRSNVIRRLVATFNRVVRLWDPPRRRRRVAEVSETSNVTDLREWRRVCRDR